MKATIVAEFKVQYIREVEIDEAEWNRLDDRLSSDEPFDVKITGVEGLIAKAEAEVLQQYLNDTKPTIKGLNFIEVHGDPIE